MKTNRVLRLAGLLAVFVLLLTLAPAAGAQPPAAPNAPDAWTFAGSIGAHKALNAVSMASRTDVWVVGDVGLVYHYNGTAWSALTSNTILDLNSVAAIPGAPGTAFVAGSGAGGVNPSTALICTVSLGSCNLVPGIDTTGVTGALDAVWANSATDAWFVGDRIILHYMGGTSWDVVLTPGTGTLPKVQYHNVQMLSASEGWMVGEAGTILHYAAGSWQVVTPDVTVTGSLRGLRFAPDGTGLIVGGQAGQLPIVLHHNPGAVNTGWTLESLALVMTSPTLFWYVCLLSNGTAYAVGNGEQIWERSAAGVWNPAFVPTGPGPFPALYGVWVVADGTNFDGWAVGGDTPSATDVTFHFTSGGGGPVLTPRARLPFIMR